MHDGLKDVTCEDKINFNISNITDPLWTNYWTSIAPAVAYFGSMDNVKEQKYADFAQANLASDCAAMRPDLFSNISFCDDDYWYSLGLRSVTPLCLYTCCMVQVNHSDTSTYSEMCQYGSSCYAHSHHEGHEGGGT